MEFHMLTRRELQALCKKNKIPANITNVAMVESLKALEIVEGIDELLSTCESETAQSSIDSPVRSEVTSPFVPLTGGRSTRRRNVAKEEPETAKQSVRAQRTTRRTRTKDSDDSQAETIETPAVAPQTNRRRKGPMASACRKMESELKECAEEEKKNVAVTPAPSGVTTQRRRGANVESEATRVYSTRRSVRLAVKNVELSSETGNENHDFSKKELFTNDCEELKTNTKEGTAVSDEVSGITGAVDADIVTVEVTSERKDEAEVISAEKHETSSVNEEGKINNSEAVGAVLEEENCDAEIEEIKKENCAETEVPNDENKTQEKVDVDIEKMGFGSEIEAGLEKEECDETGFPKDEIKAEENDGPHDFQTSEIEIEAEKIENADLDAGCEDQAANLEQNDEEQDTDSGYQNNGNNRENVVLESEGSDDIKPSEIKIDAEETEGQNTDKDAGHEDQVGNSEENAGLEYEDAAEFPDIQSSEIEIVVEKTEEQITDKGEEDTAESEDNTATGEVSCDSDITNEIEKESGDVTNLNVKDVVLEINASKHEVPSSEKEFKPDESDSFEDDSLPFDISLMSDEDEASKLDDLLAFIKEDNSAEEKPVKEFDTTTQPEENDEKAPDPLVQPTCLSPIRAPSASKASSAKKKRVTGVSDNKENIGSGGKLVFTKERVKIAKKDTAKIASDELGDMSVRQLTKLLREKLQISNKPSKNEVPSRPALQALPENRQAN